MKRMLFVYNPHAGKGLLKQKLSEIVDIIVKAGYEVVIYPTQAYRDAYRKITEMTEDYDLVVCSGGDGTIDEVVTGMMEREHKIPVGYIPTGTTNDFANWLKIPKDFRRQRIMRYTEVHFHVISVSLMMTYSYILLRLDCLPMCLMRQSRRLRMCLDILRMCWKARNVSLMYHLIRSE